MTSTQASTMVSTGTRILVIFFSLCMALIVQAQDIASLREGDLLFGCADDNNAITAVTSGVEGRLIDHVGVAHRIGGDHGPLFVIEAVKPQVCLTPIDTFLCHNPQVVVGRVNVDVDICRSIRNCLLMMGKPYDDLFLQGDSAIYCSELVQSCFVTQSGDLVFDTVPMSFHDDSGKITDYWRDFYARRGMTVPEGAPGTNPGELSRRPQVTIIGKYPIHL